MYFEKEPLRRYRRSELLTRDEPGALPPFLPSCRCSARPRDQMPEQRRFPPPWSVDDPDMKLGQACYMVRDANGHALAYVYISRTSRGDAAHLMTARRRGGSRSTSPSCLSWLRRA
jgi:hypothetical protein